MDKNKNNKDNFENKDNNDFENLNEFKGSVNTELVLFLFKSSNP